MYWIPLAFNFLTSRQQIVLILKLGLAN